MRKTIKGLGLKSWLVAATAATAFTAQGVHSVYDTRVEQLPTPLGIDAAAPRFSWKSAAQQRGFVQKSYRIIVGTDSAAVAAGQGNVWDSRKVKSDRSVLVPFEGAKLKPATPYYWRVTVEGNSGKPATSPVSRFTTGLFTPADWEKAHWIALQPDGERIVPFKHGMQPAEPKIGDYTMPMMRNAFKLADKPVASALAFVCGVGHFDFYVNGNRQGDHFLDPGWTQYSHEAEYVTFDVTDQLRSGTENVMGVMLGNGFYNIPNERYYKITGSYGAPKLKLMLAVTYADGSRQTVITDDSWRVTSSPITYSSIYGGEDYDARLEKKGWNAPGYNASAWKQPVLSENDTILLKSMPGTHLTVRHVMPVVKTKVTPAGNTVYDFGQNMSGIVRLSVKGRKGETVRLRLGEVLNPDGSVKQTASGDPYYLQYTIGADSVAETWQPQFTYYGFRYAQLEHVGADGQNINRPDTLANSLPRIIALNALHTTNSAPRVGSFACSKPIFNDIYTLIDWAIRSNVQSAITDCPHREKLGWQEQGYLMQNSMFYNYDLSALYTKILADLETAQWGPGVIPTIIPEYVRFDGGFADTPEWGSSFIFCPWEIYRRYGDDSVLRRHYPAMKRYVDYLTSRANNHIVAYGLGDWLDLGPEFTCLPQLTCNGITATATYYGDVLTLAKVAATLGLTDDEAAYLALAAKIKEAYNREFFHPEKGNYDRNSQTANAISLHYGLVPDGRRADVLRSLVDDIEGRGNALTAGDIGYRYVLRALEENGRTDVIFNMNTAYDKPGYGWQLAHDNTALNESWQAYDFVSNNHLMLGHLMEWLYSGLGGVKQAPGSIAYRTVEIDPTVVGDVTSTRTTYITPYGEVACEWKVNPDGTYTMALDVPANSSARVTLPTSSPAQVTDFGTPLAQAEGISNITPSTTSPTLTFTAGSGTYRFTVANPQFPMLAQKK